ncbi:MAG: TonB-dependent receptor [Bacteroidota bacterium]
MLRILTLRSATLATAFVLALLLSGTAAAQTGKIAGTVTDAVTGEPLPGVNVFIEGTTQGTATDFDGNFSIIGVRPDTYEIVFSFVGYRNTRVEGVRVSIDLTTRVDAELQEDIIEGEEVVVTAERALVQKDLTATTAFVSGDEIQALPVENFNEVIELQAGVVDGHFRGGRIGEVGYWVDGLPVSDVYDGGLALGIENGMVQEAQVVTGAFNAEYGQALSGIVNVVTKDGSDDFEGSFTGFLGDYLTSERELLPDTPIFPGLGDLSIAAVQNAEGNFSGPVIPGRLFFFTSGRYFKNDGWIFGEDRFRSDDVGYLVSADSMRAPIALLDSLGSGSGERVSLNPFERVSGQAKLTARLGRGMRLAANVIASREDFRDYELGIFFRPEAQRQKRRDALSTYLKWTHTLSNATFYDLGITNNYTEFNDFLFEDPLDERYEDNDFFPTEFTNAISGFRGGGTDNRRFFRSTNTLLAKFDLTSQVGSANLIKFGLEGRYHTLRFRDQEAFVIEEPPRSGGVPGGVRVRGLIDNGQYTYNPVEFSAYVQDKIELGALIINAGLRFDYFDSNGVVFRDPTDPNAVFLRNRRIVRNMDGLPIGADGNPILDEDGNPILDPERDENGEFQFYLDENGNVTNFTPDEAFEAAESSFQVSPRLGVAFPITAGGVVHFSYGQFFQTPNFELLYQNPYFNLSNSGSGLIGLIGNANLRPEQTVQGEIGLKQTLTASSAIEVTAYYRNIRNLTGTATDPIQVEGTSARYGQLVNSDFGFVRGLILRFDQRIGTSLFAGLDYTFQVARANASDPDAAYNAAATDRRLVEQQILPTSWDQRHTFTASLTYDNARFDAGFGLLMSYGSGQPFTPSRTAQQTGGAGSSVPGRLLLNSDTRPSTVNVNLTAYKNIPLFGDHKAQIFTKVDNLLDTRNENDVFSNTGRATYSLDRNVAEGSFFGDPALLNRNFVQPGFFSQPRRVVLGLRYNF